MTREEKYGVTKEFLRATFRYEDGKMIYLKTNKRGGFYSGKGYRYISSKGTIHPEHRIVWIYHNGICHMDIDHINGTRDDNRIENLQSVNRQDNLRKAKVSKNNKSGFIGVHWNKYNSKWKAEITVDYKNIHIGVFEKKEDAIKARLDAEKEHFGDFLPMREELV